MRNFKKSRKLVVVTVVAILAVSGAAFAYWTTTGGGSGSATTGTSSTVTVTGVNAISGLVPGGTAQSVDFKITNPKSTPQYVTTVTYSISSITNISDGSPATGCSSADFTLVQPNSIASDLAAGDTTFSGLGTGAGKSGATLAMNDSGTNQDGCKNTTVHLTFAAV